jgi:hypothetical protein
MKRTWLALEICEFHKTVVSNACAVEIIISLVGAKHL